VALKPKTPYNHLRWKFIIKNGIKSFYIICHIVFVGWYVCRATRFPLFEGLSDWPQNSASFLSITVWWHNSILQGEVVVVGVAAFATNCLIHLRGTKKYTGYCDKQDRRCERKRGEMLSVSLFWGILEDVVGRAIAVGMATHYRLVGSMIDSRWGRDFPCLSRPSLGPTQPPVQWEPCLSSGWKRLGRGFYHQSLSSVEVNERVELYICCSFGYSLCVLGWTFWVSLKDRNDQRGGF
jgi:hypothetical protein